MVSPNFFVKKLTTFLVVIIQMWPFFSHHHHSSPLPAFQVIIFSSALCEIQPHFLLLSGCPPPDDVIRGGPPSPHLPSDATLSGGRLSGHREVKVKCIVKTKSALLYSVIEWTNKKNKHNDRQQCGRWAKPVVWRHCLSGWRWRPPQRRTSRGTVTGPSPMCRRRPVGRPTT